MKSSLVCKSSVWETCSERIGFLKRQEFVWLEILVPSTGRINQILENCGLDASFRDDAPELEAQAARVAQAVPPCPGPFSWGKWLKIGPPKSGSFRCRPEDVEKH